MNHHLTHPHRTPLSPPTRLVYSNQPHHIAYTLDIQHAYFSLFFSLILWIHRKSGQQQHYTRFTARTYLFHSFFFSLPALESGHHTDDRIYIIYTHTDARATHLHYHMIDSPFIFLLYSLASLLWRLRRWTREPRIEDTSPCGVGDDGCRLLRPREDGLPK